MKNLSAKKMIALSLILSLLSLSVVYSNENPPSINKSNDQQLKEKLIGIDGKTAMVIANQWRMRKIDVVTFVTPDKVNFKFKDGRIISVPLPDGEMIVSIAPYINKTHTCATHYMSSCDAELKNTKIKVEAVTADGKILINKTMKQRRPVFWIFGCPEMKTLI